MEQKKKMPLEGIRVVELATVVAAPTASRVLCAFGAEVIKVETKIGDEMRRAGEFEMVVCEDDKNPLFTIQNSGKRLTSIDLKNPDGKAAMLRLLETADVFLTNVRLPSLGRLGLDYETLHAAYPGLVYAHFSGFGPKGPDAAKLGFPVGHPHGAHRQKEHRHGHVCEHVAVCQRHLVQRHRRRVAPAAVRRRPSERPPAPVRPVLPLLPVQRREVDRRVRQ